MDFGRADFRESQRIISDHRCHMMEHVIHINCQLIEKRSEGPDCLPGHFYSISALCFHHLHPKVCSSSKKYALLVQFNWLLGRLLTNNSVAHSKCRLPPYLRPWQGAKENSSDNPHFSASALFPWLALVSSVVCQGDAPVTLIVCSNLLKFMFLTGKGRQQSNRLSVTRTNSKILLWIGESWIRTRGAAQGNSPANSINRTKHEKWLDHVIRKLSKGARDTLHLAYSTIQYQTTELGWTRRQNRTARMTWLRERTGVD